MFIAAKPPFDFGKSVAFAGAFSPTGGEQAISKATLRKAFEIDGSSVLATICESPGGVMATFDADTPLAPTHIAASCDRVTFYLSLHDELAAFYARAETDRAFAPILENGYGFHQVKFASPFEAACWSILSQRTPIRLARRVKDRLVERFGTSIEREGVAFRAFPSPGRLAQRSDDELLAAGVQERRLRYLRCAIDAFAQTDEPSLRAMPTAALESWLRDIRGIGEWSSQLILLRGFGRMEIVGSGASMLEAVHAVYGPIGAAALHTLTNHYGEHAGYWLFYLRAVPALSASEAA
jgi:DNA-3-methyladenine glycosylase II